MKVIDPGHCYIVDVFDADEHEIGTLRFMKREGPGYPDNEGHYSGTNCQEVMRVLIHQIQYLNAQIPCEENVQSIANLRKCIRLFEQRAARRHGRELGCQPREIETVPTCSVCGHIECNQHAEVVSR